MQVDIHSLKKSFGDKVAVDIPDFTIHHGEILGLVGNNGAGKTTLFRLILDLLKADRGEVLLSYIPHPQLQKTDDISPVKMNPAKTEEWKQYTGTYLDEGFLIDFLTPEEYLDFIAKVSARPAINWKHLDEDESIASFLPLANHEIFQQKKLIRDFSAGNKQKIGIISAMFTHPDLLILDEPFNFLDPSGQNTLKKLLLSYHKDTGATILISSHNLQHTVDISTRIALLEKGQIIEDLNNDNDKTRQTLESYFNV